MEEKQKGRSHVESVEWKVEEHDARLVCVRYCTVEDDGVKAEPAATRRVSVELPDLRGGDIRVIAEVANRFGLDIQELAEDCRSGVYRMKAQRLVKSLIESESVDGIQRS